MLTGLVCLGLGIWLFIAPAEALPLISVIFAACLLGAGCLNLFLGTSTRKILTVWGWAIALGIIEIIGGIWLLSLPVQAMEAAFIYITGIMVLVAAINAVAEAFTLSTNNVWWTIWSVLLLVAVIVMSIIMFSSPIAWGTLSIIYLAAALVCFGVYRIGLATTLKRMANRLY